jgi:hypothetical protein
MQTKVRIFYTQDQIIGIVIPDDDLELEHDHQSLTNDIEHQSIDLSRGDYFRYAFVDGKPIPSQLHDYIKSIK